MQVPHPPEFRGRRPYADDFQRGHGPASARGRARVDGRSGDGPPDDAGRERPPSRACRRTHRFLLHNILAQRGFTPPDAIFPISSHLLKEHDLYLKALTDWSSHTVALTDWNWGPGGTL